MVKDMCIPTWICSELETQLYTSVMILPTILPFNPLHPNTRIQILRNVLYTFPKVQTRRRCVKDQELP